MKKVNIYLYISNICLIYMYLIYISPIFLAPRSDGSFRMILNFKKLNDYMPYIHFKIETIKSVLYFVTPNCCMGKIDIKDGYYSISILPEHQKFLKFSLQGKLYLNSLVFLMDCVLLLENLLYYSNPY